MPAGAAGAASRGNLNDFRRSRRPADLAPPLLLLGA